MTRDELVQAFTMRVDGASFSKIGAALGYTTENVRYNMDLILRGKYPKIRGKNRALALLISRKYRTIVSFAEACGVSDNIVRRLLRNGRVLPENREKVLAVVGPGILDKGG